MNYAQLRVPTEDDGWSAVADWVGKCGPKISALRQERLIGAATIDLAIPFDAHRASISIELPSFAAERVGRHDIDIQFSVYLTNEDG